MAKKEEWVILRSDKSALLHENGKYDIIKQHKQENMESGER